MLTRTTLAYVTLALALTLVAACSSGGTKLHGTGPRPGSVVITNNPMYVGVVGVPYSYSFAATGGTTPYTWALAAASNALPAGLTLGTDGAVSGTPTATSSAVAIVVTVTDSSTTPLSASQSFSIAVDPAGSLTITTALLTDGIVNTAYSEFLAATGGTPAYTWAIATSSANQLPAGLFLDTATGEVYGTPTAVANPVFITFEVTDSAVPADSAERAILFGIEAVAPTVIALPNATVGEPYTGDMPITNMPMMVQPLTWEFTSGSADSGLRLRDNEASLGGMLVGRARQAGAYSFTALATDSAFGTPSTIEMDVTLQVDPAFAPMPQGYVGTDYSASLRPIGGAGTYTYSAPGGLPAGLSIDAAGLVTGTPTAASDSTLTITATSSLGLVTTVDIPMTVNAAPGTLTIVTEALPHAFYSVARSQAYSTRIEAAGGAGSGYTWTLTSGSLPAGVTGISGSAAAGTPAITLSGTPTTFGSFPITVQVSDGTLNDSADFTLVVARTPCDFNRDGYNDVIVGSPNDNYWPTSSSFPIDADIGGMRAFGGSPDMAADIDAGTGYDVYALNRGSSNNNDNQHFGTSVASAGDFNGDGYDDIIVGGPDIGAAGVNLGTGGAYIYFGASTATPVTYTMAQSSANVKITGATAGDQLGNWVSGIGDFNGDGYDDVAIGVTKTNSSFDSEGGAYIFFGRAMGGTFTSSDANIVLTGEWLGYFGFTLSSAGDFNNDGFDDLIVGARECQVTGAAFIYLGRSRTVSAAALTLASTDAELVINGRFLMDEVGVCVSSAGDFNGDGFGDVVIGADRAHAGATWTAPYNQEGAAYVVLGRNAVIGQAQAAIAADEAEFRAVGDVPLDINNPNFFGHAVAGIGDLNGDGFDDIAVGAPDEDTIGANAGAAWIFLGRAGAAGDPQTTLATTDAASVLTPSGAGDAFGKAISGAGDLNGDGYDDLVVGAPTAKDSAQLTITPGSAYIFFGAPLMPSSIASTHCDVAIYPGLTSVATDTLAEGFGASLGGR